MEAHRRAQGRAKTGGAVMATTAPFGWVWQCGACAKRSFDRYGREPIDPGWDESCYMHANLIEEDEAERIRADFTHRMAARVNSMTPTPKVGSRRSPGSHVLGPTSPPNTYQERNDDRYR